MTVTATDSIVREKAEPETSSFATSSALLDTEIDCKIWALGITEKTDCAEVMLEKENGFRQLEGVQSKLNAEAKDTRGQQPQPQQRHKQLFDFVHIRYQNSGISDGRRVFRLAFEQTKPGGWIEVLEAAPVATASNGIPEACPSPNQRTLSSPRKAGEGNSNTAYWVKQQLSEAGFVDVEEKVARLAGAAAPPASTPWGKLWGLGQYMKQLCSGLVGLQWRCGDVSGTLVADEKARILSESPSVFVIARKPVIKH